MRSKLFLDENGGVSLARYEKVKYPIIDKITQDMISLFWVPEEIDLSKDRRDFEKLTDGEKHIFTSNLKRQTLMDTIQGRAPSVTFLPATSSPEFEAAVDKVCYDESIHSRSYTHIIRNLYNSPSEIFDEILDTQQIVELAEDIAIYYDALHMWNCKREIQSPDYDEIEHKKAIYLALVSWNALESTRFYVSFACSWAFAESGRMVGNADIIKLISRDEERHKLLTTRIINLLKKDDPDFERIIPELEGQATEIYVSVIEQEKRWSEYLFKDGGMIGLNAGILSDYVEWLGSMNMKVIKLDSPYNRVKKNPIPWINSWINSASVQVAPQETEITSYLNGIILKDTTDIDKNQLFNVDEVLNSY